MFDDLYMSFSVLNTGKSVLSVAMLFSPNFIVSNIMKVGGYHNIN